MQAKVKAIQVTKIGEGTIVSAPDLLSVEEPMEIRLGFGPLGKRMQKSLSITMRTPANDFELALGFLFTESIVTDYEQVESIKYCADADRSGERENVVRIELKPEVDVDLETLQRHFYTTSSCGVCGKASLDAVAVCSRPVQAQITIPAQVIHRSPYLLQQAQAVFTHTGGLHAAGLFDVNGNLLMLREDVGRHNALDKVIGACLIQGMVPLENYFILVSGRTSFELVQKAAISGIPLLAAVGAPSSLAVDLAVEMNMTLIGFVRDGRFNIYSFPERVRLPEKEQVETNVYENKDKR